MKIVAIGSGHRIQDALLPVIQVRKDEFELLGIFSRSAKTLTVRGETHQVQTMDALDHDLLKSSDLLYCAVPPQSLPQVLQGIVDLGPFEGVLMVDTPPMRIVDLHKMSLYSNFRTVVCAEDMIDIPWMATVEAFESAHSSGLPESVELDRSGWEYHGVAMLKRIFRNHDIIKSSVSGKTSSLAFTSGQTGVIINPRDYDNGTISIRYKGAEIVSRAKEGALLLEGVERDAAYGFRIGETATVMTAEETRIFGDRQAIGKHFDVVKHMHDCKRVGFSRLLTRIAKGEISYEIHESNVDNMICFMNSRFGFWRKSFLTDPSSPVFRKIATVLGKLRSMLK